MKTRAAVLWEPHAKWSVEELELAPPRTGQVTVEIHTSGLCHSDDHLVTGDMPSPYPIVGGHEGAGTVVEVGEGVTRLKVGDPVVTFPMPTCGRCRYCSSGRGVLCDLSAYTASPTDPEGNYRFTKDGTGVAAFTQLGTFSEYTTVQEAQVFKLPDDIPLDLAALVGCGFSTGYGATVRTGATRPGEHVVVIGVGGVGMAAVQGARVAGAATVTAIDPIAFRREQALKMGATHVAASVEEAEPELVERTHGAGADVVVITVGVLHAQDFGPMSDLVGKGGRLVLTSVTPYQEVDVRVSLSGFALAGRSIIGNLAGSTNAINDFEDMWRLHRAGKIDLRSMITRTFSLDQVNEGYAAMHAGETVRGVLSIGGAKA